MYISTPLIRSAYFPQDVLLKLENTQPSGSFKSRGITLLIQDAVEKNRHCQVFSSSGGNAGLAAAEAAKGFGVPCTVVVPLTTKPRMAERIRKLGAKVVVHGGAWAEADSHLQELMEAASESGLAPIYCHPFDNPIIWEGHSSLVDELVDQIKLYGAKQPSAIVLSCGGGGLYMGVMRGLERVGWAGDTTVFVVETVGAPTFHNSLAAKKPVKLTEINTIATSLGASYIPNEVLDAALKYNSQSALVTDEEAALAIKQFASDHCMLVEPACSATLSVIYSGKLAAYAEKGPVVAIVCGGTSWGSVDN